MADQSKVGIYTDLYGDIFFLPTGRQNENITKQCKKVELQIFFKNWLFKTGPPYFGFKLGWLI